MVVGVDPAARPGRGALDAYVPRVLLAHLADAPDHAFRAVDGSAVMADVSGFTRLSERLARLGRQGAEELVESISTCFSSLLEVAYDNGGSLLKFGGDALFLLFDGDDHAARACRSALAMRRRLRDAGRIATSGGNVRLRMSQGVHSGVFHLFLVGGSHRELLVAGPAASAVVAMEKVADAGEVVMSAGTARLLPAACAGAPKGDGVLLASAPPGAPSPVGLPPRLPPLDAVAGCLSTEVRAHVLDGRRAPPEHRTVTVAFVNYGGTDAVVARDGAAAAAAALDEVVRAVQRAADARRVCFLQSDVDADGGKIVLTAGAPRSVGDEEERMLLTVREILDADLRLPVRVGVNRGSVFCADVGPDFRRTYSAMGDPVNLAARLMAAAPWGECYATPAVLDRSPTSFARAELPPMPVKGKAKPVTAVRLGLRLDARGRGHIAEHFPLVGRDRELRALRSALADATGPDREGRVVALGGEPGIGKTRLLEELRENAGDVRRLAVVCEPYTAAEPYAPWRSLLRAALGLAPQAPAPAAAGALRDAVARAAPELGPWLPLLAIPLGAELEPTRQVRELAQGFRAARLQQATARFLRAVLREPALITIEAAEHMDRASAELLHATTADLRGVPWLVVVTRREAEGTFRLPDGAGHLHLELGPLAPADTLALAELVTEAAPLAPHVVRLAAERSAGNPQFLRDLLRAADADPDAPPPDSIETAAMAQMDRLGRADRALIRRAAVAGQTFDAGLLPELLEQEAPPPDAETWQRLRAYFQRDGRLVRFRRSVVRDVAYGALPFRTRRRLHAALAARIRRDAGVDVDEHAAILSLHLHRAGDDEAAWRFARIAGDRSRDRFAFAEAAVLYRRALAAARALEVPPADLAGVWIALADAQAHTGEPAAASRSLMAARRLLTGDPLREAELLLRHGALAERADRTVAAARWLRRGLRVLDGLEGPRAAALRARLEALLATALQRQGRSADVLVLAGRAIADAEATGEDAALAQACVALDWALLDADRLERPRHWERALAIYERLGELDRQAAVLNNLGAVAYFDGRWEDAVALYRRAADASERAGDSANAAFGDLNVGEVLSDQGHLGEAEELLRTARRIWRGSDYPGGAATAAAFLGRALTRAGRTDEGLALLEEALADLRRLRVDGEVATTEAYLAEARAFRREPELALAGADRLLAQAQRSEPLLRRVRGVALAQLGDRASALAAMREAVAVAARQGADYDQALSLDALVALMEPDDLEVRGLRRRRDALLRRLRVVAVARPPLPVTRGSSDRPRTRSGSAP